MAIDGLFPSSGMTATGRRPLFPGLFLAAFFMGLVGALAGALLASLAPGAAYWLEGSIAGGGLALAAPLLRARLNRR